MAAENEKMSMESRSYKELVNDAAMMKRKLEEATYRTSEMLLKFSELNLVAAEALDPDLVKMALYPKEDDAPKSDIDWKKLSPIPDEDYLALTAEVEDIIKSLETKKSLHEKRVEEIRAQKLDANNQMDHDFGLPPFDSQMQNIPDPDEIYAPPFNAEKCLQECYDVFDQLKKEIARPLSKMRRIENGILGLLEEPKFRQMLAERNILEAVDKSGIRETLENNDPSKIDVAQLLQRYRSDPRLHSIIKDTGIEEVLEKHTLRGNNTENHSSGGSSENNNGNAGTAVCDNEPVNEDEGGKENNNADPDDFDNPAALA